jgi:hypothetical protein
MNALTSMSIRKAFIPVRLPDDRKVIQACFTTLGPVPADTVRAVIIRDTSYLSEFWVSHALTSELRLTQGAEMLESLHLRFDKDGNLCVPNFR